MVVGRLRGRCTHLEVQLSQSAQRAPSWADTDGGGGELPSRWDGALACDGASWACGVMRCHATHCGG
eukprot:scaffold94711_cov66-Phaeocystis_antarctica.AAC.1